MIKVLKWAFVLVVLSLLGCVAFYSFYPDIARLKRKNPGKTAFMEYREREWKARGRALKIQRKWASYSHISPYVIKAVIISEDDKFWSHQGFDFDAMEKALEKDLEQGKFKFGGSTISQQLVKNLYLSPTKSPSRKLAEAVITWRMERTLSKRRIIELYLNVAEWGEGVFGVEAASLTYFGKPASSLSPEEASRLAAVLPNPRRYKANGSARFVERRARLIYHIMVRRGIVVEEYEEAAHQNENELPPPAGEREAAP